MANTTAEILWQLDRFAEHWGVPALDDGALYPVDCRLTCYADKVHWAMVLEVLEFAPNGTGHGGIVTNVFSFGNCIRVKVGGNHLHQILTTSDGPEGPTFAFTDPPSDDVQSRWEYLHPRAKTMRIRGTVVPIETDPDAYYAMGINLLDPTRIKGHELLRGLPLKYRTMLLCTDEERVKKILKNQRPPGMMQPDEWYHPKLSEGELPSQTETFQMVAEVLVTGELSRYRPTKLPNTHWSNWPKAGMFERPAGW